MSRRLGLPLVVTVLLVAIVLVSLRLGYLGRRDGGPLQLSAASALRGDASLSRFNLAIGRYEVRRGPVRLQGVTDVRASPGMRVDGPRRYTGRRPVKVARFAAGAGRGRIGGKRLRGSGRLALGLRVRQPGTYILWRWAVNYGQGARSYRRAAAGPPICVTRGGRCPAKPRLPDAEATPLADIGGPSDYGSRPRAPSEGSGLPEVSLRRGASTPVTLTLTNMRDRAITVAGLRLPGAQRSALRSRAVHTFTLAARSSRATRLAVSAEPARPGESCPDPALAPTAALRARVDGASVSVPLLVALRASPVAGC